MASISAGRRIHSSGTNNSKVPRQVQSSAVNSEKIDELLRAEVGDC